MRKFNDFAPSKAVEGTKIKIDELLGKEIVVIGYIISQSKFKTNESCLKLQIQFNGENRVVFTGSNVLRKQCEEHESKMPFEAIIIKVDSKYYTFS